MGARAPTAMDAADIIGLCRRLASALQDEESVLSAIAAAGAQAPSGQRGPLAHIRDRGRSGGRVSAALMDLHCPSVVWGAVRAGEGTGLLRFIPPVLMSTISSLALSKHLSRQLKNWTELSYQN